MVKNRIEEVTIMPLHLISKDVPKLQPTGILFQTEYWAHVKSRLGWAPYAFDIGKPSSKMDVLVLVKSLGPNRFIAYVPQGPEAAPGVENYGAYLERISESLVKQLNGHISFIRYDLPWESPYANDMEEKECISYPDARIREIRMNFGTRRWNLRKAPKDMTPTDALIVDIGMSEEEMLSRMRPKTRYNIKLAQRKGVRIDLASPDRLRTFYEMHCETARRNQFYLSDYHHFSALFSPGAQHGALCNTVLLLATHDQDLLAGAIVAISSGCATFLHGASSNIKRNYMASYALHWGAIRYARSQRCLSYDMGAVSPNKDPDHHFFGLYRFKMGFGGRMVHRSGTWDYPIQEDVYTAFRNWEQTEDVAVLH